MSPSMLRLVASKSQNSLRYNLHVACSVKPNVSANRVGVTVEGSDRANLSVAVSAVPRDGASNRAVMQMIAEVLKVPKSSVEVLRGAKSREKVLCIADVDIGDSEEAFLQQTTQRLIDASRK
ncbi:hypothetical protein N7495_001099 [Penicillium taxi]|uniref:uncharacterized protein n=1 Tax=Penicillium taxi TaxID=168475 RepID=UPI0025452FE2|nr:uncharacterized protein N7495_001099 [Penicillium taxi]KAJ5908417.1 hypothetical protein N7495_001099 [Penicillium taxi]